MNVDRDLSRNNTVESFMPGVNSTIALFAADKTRTRIEALPVENDDKALWRKRISEHKNTRASRAINYRSDEDIRIWHCLYDNDLPDNW